MAALYRDEKLIAMYNAGDTYSEMAKIFYKDRIEMADLKLKGNKFKQKYPKERDTMKTCMLGVIYGMTPTSLGKLLNCPVREAERLHQKVISMMSKFKSIQAIAEWSGIRGYSSTVTNLHRHRKDSGKVAAWEKRGLLNYSIQGTGAVIFKATANRLVKLYKPFDARIMVPLHDSFVFETPEKDFKKGCPPDQKSYEGDIPGVLSCFEAKS